MRLFLIFLLFFFSLSTGCQTIENKTQKAIKEENKKLSKFLKQSETELKIEMGEPERIIYDDKGSKFLVYSSKKYGITCERRFEVDKKQIVIGFLSKGCF